MDDLYSNGMVFPLLVFNDISNVEWLSLLIALIAVAAFLRSSSLYQESGAFIAAISSSLYPLIFEKLLFQTIGLPVLGLNT